MPELLRICGIAALDDVRVGWQAEAIHWSKACPTRVSPNCPDCYLACGC